MMFKTTEIEKHILSLIIEEDHVGVLYLDGTLTENFYAIHPMDTM